MKAPTGKLAFAYQTIANLEARITELESRPPAPGAVPEGWKLVPIEPTELMIRRGDQNYSWSVAKIYKAMIDDAPASLPRQGQGAESMSDKLKLLPCPFCGGPAEHSTYSGVPVIWCKAFGECQGMMGGEEYDGTAEQLAASWNTRPALDTTPGSTLKVMLGPGGGLYLSGVEDLREGDVFRREVRQ